MKRDIDFRFIGTLAAMLLITFIVFRAFTTMHGFSDRSGDMQTAAVLKAIRNAAVQCYALEGEYPPSLEYLENNYLLIVDKDKYVVFYDASLGSNMMPDISVLIRPEAK